MKDSAEAESLRLKFGTIKLFVFLLKTTFTLLGVGVGLLVRLEEVAVAVRGYGFPGCPKNSMAWFLRAASKRVVDDFPHLRAVATDINPNWGFSGGSFLEAGFIPIGLKHAPTAFVGDEYFSRRSLDGQHGRKAATPNRLSLVPTIIMLKPLETSLKKRIEEAIKGAGLYTVPRNLYNDT